jgi:hypothetical protein
MTDVTVINTTTSVTVADDGAGPSVVVEVIGQPVIQASTIGIQGPAGSGGGSSIAPGPGFALVGAEIRYAISTLTRA